MNNLLFEENILATSLPNMEKSDFDCSIKCLPPSNNDNGYATIVKGKLETELSIRNSITFAFSGCEPAIIKIYKSGSRYFFEAEITFENLDELKDIMVSIITTEGKIITKFLKLDHTLIKSKLLTATTNENTGGTIDIYQNNSSDIFSVNSEPQSLELAEELLTISELCSMNDSGIITLESFENLPYMEDIPSHKNYLLINCAKTFLSYLNILQAQSEVSNNLITLMYLTDPMKFINELNFCDNDSQNRAASDFRQQAKNIDFIITNSEKNKDILSQLGSMQIYDITNDLDKGNLISKIRMKDSP